MKINLNDPSEFTLENVAKLIASKDDSKCRQLRVTVEGIAFLSDEVGGDNADNYAYCFETWDNGNDWVGEGAARDEKWVLQIYTELQENWPNPKR